MAAATFIANQTKRGQDQSVINARTVRSPVQLDHLVQTIAQKQFLPQTEYPNLVLASVRHIVCRTTPQIGSLMHNTLSACLIYHLLCVLIGPGRYYEALAACL